MSRPGALENAIGLTREEEYLEALTIFLEVYGSEDVPPLRTPRVSRGLSFFGLCIALIQRKYKLAIELCNRAIMAEFYNGDHYANLARVYVAAGNRRKGLETIDQGLKVAPEHKGLLTVRAEMGNRAKPPIPFLSRSHPLNVALGQARYAKKLEEDAKKKQQ